MLVRSARSVKKHFMSNRGGARPGNPNGTRGGARRGSGPTPDVVGHINTVRTLVQTHAVKFDVATLREAVHVASALMHELQALLPEVQVWREGEVL